MTAVSACVPWAWRPRLLSAVAAALLGCALVCGPAHAAISASQVLDGPTNDILDVDGAALAPDGTGGIVYRKEVGGVDHVFAVPVDDGQWGSPVEVDTADAYGASEPAIGAQDGGGLLVVWVQPRAIASNGTTLYELMSAYMGPGASTFAPAIMVDPNVGEPDTGTFSAVEPRIAMAPDGDAYVVYRADDDDCETSGLALDQGNPFNPECPVQDTSSPTAAIIEIRVARFAQGPWSSMGEINRAPQLAMRIPSADNEPSIAIGDGKAGLVVWQEPDATGIARIWARRLFGTTVGNVIQLSPSTINGQAVGADADSPAAGFDDAGLATASFRLQGGPGSPLGAAEVMSQVVPASEASITPASNVGGSATISSPSLAEGAGGEERIAYVSGGEAYATNGSAEKPVALGAAAGGDAFTSVDPDGGGVTAWLGSQNGLPVVDINDQFPTGGAQYGELVGGLPGPITGLSFGSDPQGDAIVAWMQGSPGDSEVVASVADGSPQRFIVQTPTGWQAGDRIRVSWNPAAASTAVTYSVLVNGRVVLRGLHGPSATAPATSPQFPSRPVSSTGEAATITRSLPLGKLGQGVKHVQIIATDAGGQSVTSAVHTIKIDRTPPLVTLARIDHGHGVRVTVSDSGSGVDAGATRLSFGDGAHSSRHAVARHVYRRSGSYTIVARVEDRAGNRATINLKVRVR
ncbi:MAG TPA: PKD domain-containing protein [Solirubrobacteraceae bacterium]|nr:PKD domain-containing protein [Solirubrobacteraceae bacterium]